LISWMADEIPCHGALNKRPSFVLLNVAQDTTYTVTMSTLDAPITALVSSVWDGCPFDGGQLVASIECGGWDCIEWSGIGFEATISLLAGNYWWWNGLYSDGTTCVGGIVQGNISIGGECEADTTPEPMPCPEITVDFDGQVVTYCDGDINEIIETGIPCTPAGNYSTVAFTVTETPYPIHVWSDFNYIEFPTSPINAADIGIFDECGGDLLYYSGAGACQVGSAISPPAPNVQEYTLMLDLPLGNYIAVIGFWAADGNPYTFEGCIEYTFGPIGFLDGADMEQEQGGGGYREPSTEYVPRYTKVVIEGRGVFIRDNHSGQLYDVVTRKVVE